MRRSARVLFIAFALTAVASTVIAASGLTVQLNQSRRILLHGAAANVIVGDPTIADVAMIDSHSIILMGRGYGSTDVMVLDRAGHALLDSRVTVTAANDGRVTVYRGVVGSDFSCASRCQAIGSAKDPAAPAGGAAPASGAPAPAPQPAPTSP
jgi:Flp pilus assembly secretin CpaC